MRHTDLKSVKLQKNACNNSNKIPIKDSILYGNSDSISVQIIKKAFVINYKRYTRKEIKKIYIHMYTSKPKLSKSGLDLYKC